MTPNNGPRLAHGASGQHAPRGRSSRPRLIALLLTAVFATGLAATAVAATPALPACKIGDVYTKHRGYSDWSRSLLDTTYRLWSGYAPSDLRNTSLAGLNSGYYVRSFVVADLKAMAAAAKAAGAQLSVQSGYRSYSAQITAFNNEIRIYGYATALTTSARPGHSEHQLGTTLDFKSYGGSAAWNYADWGTSAAGKWLKANAWKYGFVMPYPKGKSSVTCYAYEPWHFRYVGRAKAADVMASGLTLRQYLWRQQTAPTPTATPTLTPSPAPTPTPTPTPEPSPSELPPPG